jgi:hypothetical protein
MNDATTPRVEKLKRRGPLVSGKGSRSKRHLKLVLPQGEGVKPKIVSVTVTTTSLTFRPRHSRKPFKLQLTEAFRHAEALANAPLFEGGAS